ncbi:lipopolysaccharide biosynthesis protein [Massilibacteroides sp.]|uniref:lipopolysaccharide biosynthesis protein n=1 Tax=Massilibacteroides sp. TaxID=2034766 RepID=UPI0026214063|nr:lipopolysaccharide biosynthesis protein [Massilibacteroides sp.]MDD4515367.1 lipopolysaccharide biosynthesis protein [Massilibacteroides sp.]
MAEQSLKDKTASGLLWGGTSNVLTLIFGIVLARILNAEDYGMIGMLTIFIAVSSTIMDCGFVNALINKKNVSFDDYNSIFWFSTLSGIILYVLLYFSAPYIALFFDNAELIDLSRFLFICVGIGGLGVVHNAILLKEIRIKEKAKIDIISLALSNCVGISFSFAGYSYWALAFQTITYSASLIILRWWFVKWRPNFNINFAPIKEMFGFSSKIFITNLFFHINNHLFSVVFGRLYDEKQVGFYSQGQKWMTMGQSLISGAINGIAQPVFVQVKDDPDRQKHVFRKILRFGAFISFPLMLGIAFIGKELIVIAIGEKWLNAVPFLQLFCIWGAFSYIWTLCTNLLISHGKSNLYMYGMILTCIIQLALVLLVSSYGIYTMVIAYLSINFIALYGWIYFVGRLTKLTFLEVTKDIFPFLIITIISVAIAWFTTKNISNLYLLFLSKICITAVIYILVMWKSNAVVFKESIRFLKQKK